LRPASGWRRSPRASRLYGCTVHLVLQDYLVEVGSFWNLAAPGISLGIFVVGLFVWGLSRSPGGSRIGLVVLTIGVAAFLVSCVVDGARNISDVNELASAVHSRYGVDIDYAQGVLLFQSAGDDQPVELTAGGRTVEAVLHRSPDGSFTLV